MFSSGITSWAAGKRYAQQHGTDGMVLLFADTLIEDEDNYRFLEESAENIGAPLVRISEGRTPWQVMRDRRIIGNSRIDPCSMVLKRQLLDGWRDQNCLPMLTKIILGINWDESHRIDRVRERAAPWDYIAPLCDKPWMSKSDCLAWAASEGVKPPRMYDMGFPHANCGGFCIKAGQKSFALLLEHFPERYAAHEAEEESMREMVGDHSIMTDRSGDGKKKPLTMRRLRERIQGNQPIDEHDLGGCACALPI
jgi:3'-phosphoadenosine 5'-phosphosulfate sulfotransferase (PAPS reductase)/FAD synthetase